jgi:hypothetical protein
LYLRPSQPTASTVCAEKQTVAGPKTSAVKAPTQGCVIRHRASGHFSTSCSIAWLNPAMVGTVLIETTPIVACCDFAELPQTDTKPLTEIQPSAVVQVDVVLPANDPAEEINDF